MEEKEALQKEILDLIREHQAKTQERQEQIEEQLRLLKESKPDPQLAEQIKENGEALGRLRVQIEELRQGQVPGGGLMVGESFGSIVDQMQKHDKLLSLKERGWQGTCTVNIKGGLFPITGQKTTITSGTVGSSTPGILVPDRVRDLVTLPRRRFTIRDLLGARTTASNAVEYPQVNTVTSAASPQVEGSSKEESTITFTIAYANVRTIAHWIPATTQVLDDWGVLDAYIRDELLYRLKLKEETELLSGDGLGVHLTGLTTAATAYAGTYNVANDQRLDRLNHAKLELLDHDEYPNFCVLNPADWSAIQLLKTQDSGTANTGAYLVGDPLGGYFQIPTVWGLAVIVSNSMANGAFLVGDSSQAEVFDRMQAAVVVSTEHDDYFIRNMVAIRAEERIALAIYRTGAFIYGTF